MKLVTTVATLVLLNLTLRVKGHGRLRVPPARSTLFRDGITPNVPDYNDNQLFCGGVGVQHDINNGKCGLCGDAYHLPKPRPHEHGGKYGLGTIAGSYTQGQDIDIAIEITAHHRGWFEFKLCPYAPATQECLDSNKLQLTTGTDRYLLPDNGVGFYNMSAHLPQAVSCQQCVLQWRYHTGNSWGCSDDGNCCLGCGDKQEEFYGCADITILATGPAATSTTTKQPTSSTASATESTTTSSTSSTTSTPPTTPASESSTTSTVANVGDCEATGAWLGDADMTDWCNDNCHRDPPNCPETLCSCSNKAESTTTSSSTSSSSKACAVYSPVDTTDLFLVIFCNSICPGNSCSSFCRCADDLECQGVGTFSGIGDEFCTDRCRHGNCPPKYCSCW